MRPVASTLRSGAAAPNDAGAATFRELTVALARDDFDVVYLRTALTQGYLTKERAQVCLAALREDRARGRRRGARALLAEQGIIEELLQALDLLTGPPPDAPPEIPGFRLEWQIGAGAMGTVWLAHQLSMDRPVALKILSPALARNRAFIERFVREARAAAKFHHVNIVGGYDVGEANGRYYFAMEYAPGVTLRRTLEDGPLDERRALDLTRQVARALARAAQMAIVHRDIKPDNIIVTDEGVVKLLDLGLARRAGDLAGEHEGQVVGTPNYLAPEQALGKPDLDSRADLYSLGATLYHMLTGHTLFSGPPEGVILAHVNDAPRHPRHSRPELSENACLICEQLLAKKPEHRYQRPEALIADLDRALAGEELELDPVLTFDDPPEGAEEEEAPAAGGGGSVRRRRRRRRTAGGGYRRPTSARAGSRRRRRR